MSEEKVKKGYPLIPPTVTAQSGYFAPLWDNPASAHECSSQVLKSIGQCWASFTDPIAKKDIDGLFIGPKGEDHFVFVSLKDQLIDYIRGAGSAMNPMPNEVDYFDTSDAEAMASDWNTAINDMYTVLKANDLFGSKYRHLKDEQPIGREQSGSESSRLERSRLK